ncbi:3-keto-L-gulonate-6-phosphate decarboxylase/transcriptional regulator with XRE-family HTH domain [Micromonospora echinospora]|uniref:3-keto-L-gulonate-6-phosphate decarboxylase/transcriptional regulator with XRE-family HTH domain n=1 Tax=Micromonospora echinospora TaxID=1877 RepID=A0ABR6M7L6_MICEC|nr:orotidine 5'-phosphate decarboxylase / HUMPS family protein [Micromonospora echinospora]MBB5111377.1 3-keto-L-gulonate-6-phosphate decarboxylase/transcriptional regulator with XRE-family HTH domain [Micromonospora echinospora]
METVRRWTGREAKALRLALRMSVRGFAEHLGVNPAAISNWEKRGAATRMRYETQQMLDVDLARSPTEVKQRFAQTLKASATAEPSASTVPAGGSRPTRQDLGTRSQERTAAVLAALGGQQPDDLAYMPPADIQRLVADFLASTARVYLIIGPPGCGKTSFTRHLASRAPGADVQLLTADSWTEDTDLAREILRYGSQPAGEDSLLTLEVESRDLSRPLLVVIDSPQSHAVVDKVCRQLDATLRQVLSGNLRFLLVLRTPPEIELAPYPVLSAAVMPGQGQAQSAEPSMRLDRWDVPTAREVWNAQRHVDEPLFDALPPKIRNLARLPLYMSLIRAAKSTEPLGQPNAYRLVEFCVASILKAASLDVDRATGDLTALARRQLAAAWPHPLLPAIEAKVPGDIGELTASPIARLLRSGRSGVLTFHHDVIREFLFARWLAQVIEAHGRSTVTIELLNDLAARTSASGDLRGVLEFLLQGLDATSPELLAAVAQSPSISITETLPLMLELTGESPAFTTAEVLRVCASRCLHDNGLPLARALLHTNAAATALGAEYPRWMLRVLRRFGPAVWSDIVACVETQLPLAAVHDFVRLAQLDTVEDAVFLARHFYVFLTADGSTSQELKTLLAHPDWRARAALAEGIRTGHAIPHQTVFSVMEALTADRDYKVRAAAAETVGQLTAPGLEHLLATLLDDRNWHVRERLLRGLSFRVGDEDSAADLVIRGQDAWRNGPRNVRVAAQRLLLKCGRTPLQDEDSSRSALFGLLREIRTGALRLPTNVQSTLTRQGIASADWLVRTEANLLEHQDTATSAATGIGKEAFRRLRDRRALQVALDVRDVDHAIAVAQAAASAGVQFIEIGDPLIKSVGVQAISAVKQRTPDAWIVAEMMSADWGRDQVVLAAEAGADVVLLIGPASIASVSAAAEASRRLGIPIIIDVPEGRLAQGWVQDMERAGVDGFAITTNIDLGVAGFHPLDQAQLIRSWTKLPVAVSGGFEPTDVEASRRRSWDILVVGRGVTDSLDPAVAARDLAASIELTEGHHS